MRRTAAHLTQRIDQQRRHQSHLRSTYEQRAVDGGTREEAEAHALQSAQLAIEANLLELVALRASVQHAASYHGKLLTPHGSGSILLRLSHNLFHRQTSSCCCCSTSHGQSSLCVALIFALTYNDMAILQLCIVRRESSCSRQ